MIVAKLLVLAMRAVKALKVSEMKRIERKRDKDFARIEMAHTLECERIKEIRANELRLIEATQDHAEELIKEEERNRKANVKKALTSMDKRCAVHAELRDC